MKQPRYQDFVDELAAGLCPGVFVDDTGSPGLGRENGGPHPERKSWVAVVLTPENAREVFAEFPGALAELQESFHANEFHFADVYAGRGTFKGVPIAARLGIFEFMANIFKTYDFPVLVQTFDPENLLEIRRAAPLPEHIPGFDLRKPEDAALFFLLLRTKWFLESQPSKPARVFVDEGFKKKGTAMLIAPCDGAFADGMICFARSESVWPIQLADFAAFCLNRWQILFARDEISKTDRQFLEILSPIVGNYRNITRLERTLDDWKPRGTPKMPLQTVNPAAGTSAWNRGPDTAAGLQLNGNPLDRPKDQP